MVSVSLMTLRFVPILTVAAIILVAAFGTRSGSAQMAPDSIPYPIETEKPAAEPSDKPASKPTTKSPAAGRAATTPTKSKPAVATVAPRNNSGNTETGVNVFAGLPADERLKLQAALLWSGDYTGSINSDDPMLTAVRNFQKRMKAKVTGRLTDQERSTLLAAASDHEKEFGWSVVADPATGIRIGLPVKMVPHAREAAHGTRWSSDHGEIQVETFRFKEDGIKLSELFERVKQEPAARRVEYSVLRDDNFFVSGLQGLKKFSVRAQMRNGEVRGFTMLFDQAMEGIVAPVMVAMASAFSPFPQHSAPFAALAKPVEYGNGLVVSTQGHIVTDARLVHGCQVIVAVGLGDADHIGDDRNMGLALLRVYAPRRFRPLSLVDGSGGSGHVDKNRDLTLTGIPDPKEHHGRSGITEIKARLTDGNAIELRQPVPMAGFTGAAALDGQRRLLGMAEMRNAVLASTGNAVPPLRLVRTETIRDFLGRHHVPAAPLNNGDVTESVVRVICVRK